jgi:hypothetical protein
MGKAFAFLERSGDYELLTFIFIDGFTGETC